MAMGGTPVQQAVRWIVEQLKHDPKRKIIPLVDEACMRFNLNVGDCEFLYRTYIYKKDPAPTS